MVTGEAPTFPPMSIAGVATGGCVAVGIANEQHGNVSW
jgi:hypothetical protein